jgi:transcriptional regulator with XRE-family HTH domain
VRGRSSPDPARRSLGAELRRLREEAGLTGVEMASKAGMSQSKVSKLETGFQLPDADDVEALGKAARVPARALASLVAEAQRLRLHYQTWLRAQPQGLAVGQHAYGLVEREAWSVMELATMVIPGLLQTPGYARDILALVAYQSDDLEAALAERLRRQTVLDDARRTFRFLLLEGTLYYRYSSARIMDQQLAQLEALSRWDNVEIGILPSTRALVRIPQHSFTVFDRALTLIETVSGPLSIVDASDVAEYVDLAERLWVQAVSDDAAVAMIRSAQSRLKRAGS